jgi:hypothetical protein
MARYQVPQFIEVEDKIFGPLTFKQFIYIAGGGGLCLVFFTLLPVYISVIFIIPVAAFALALAFYKVNGRPFIVSVEHAVGYFFGHKLYLWKQRGQQQAPSGKQSVFNTPAASQLVPKLSQSKLKDLSWSLNIKDRAKMGVVGDERTGFEI